MYFSLSLAALALAAGSATANNNNNTVIVPAVDNGRGATISQLDHAHPVLTSFITLASATTTETVLITPLPSSEAKKQEAAYRKAKQDTTGVAAQVSQALATQGKAVPSALVPAQPKQTEIKHSGLENIVNIIQNTDYSRHVATSPENGDFYIMFFNGTDTTEADEYAKKNHAVLPHTISNPSKQGMCILGHAMNLKTMKVTPFAFPDTKVGQIYVPANNTVQIGNFMPETVDHGNNGRIQARFNCDSDCQKCAGDKVGPVVTLVEFNHINKGNGNIFSYNNPSNVDGFHANFNVAYFNSKGGVCKNRQCNVTSQQLQKVCPKSNAWSDKETSGCKSDCKLTGRDDHCCVGTYGGPGNCPASSGFLHELCPDAYSWAYDDAEHTDTCDGTEKIHISFWPITKEQ